MLQALEVACRSSGVRLREHTPVEGIELDAERVRGVRLADGGFVAAGQVVLAAGAWTQGIGGLGDQLSVPVRPVKGQVMRLRDPSGPGLVQRVLRFEGGYIVPRGDGRYVLGATVEERGFELAATVGGVYELLRDAHELVPGLSELEIEELSVGLRPGTPDNTPVIGYGGVPGLVWAAGHHRNGVLLAPITAQLTAQLLTDRGHGEALDPLIEFCSPARFGRPAAASAEPDALERVGGRG